MKRWVDIALLGCMLAVAQVGGVGRVMAQQRLEAPVAVAPTVTGEQGRILLSAGTADATFCIYSITGQLLRSVQVRAGSRQTVDVPQGFYVVKCNNLWSRKVVVR